MKKILIVGFIDYEYEKKLANKYPNILWFPVNALGVSNSANALIELVNAMDSVMFADCHAWDRLTYEVACSMMKKTTCEYTDYPVEEKACDSTQAQDTSTK